MEELCEQNNDMPLYSVKKQTNTWLIVCSLTEVSPNIQSIMGWRKNLNGIILNSMLCCDWFAGGWRWAWWTWLVHSIGWFTCGCCRRPSGLEEICRLNLDHSAASSRKTTAESRLCNALWSSCQVRCHIINAHIKH